MRLRPGPWLALLLAAWLVPGLWARLGGGQSYRSGSSSRSSSSYGSSSSSSYGGGSSSSSSSYGSSYGGSSSSSSYDSSSSDYDPTPSAITGDYDSPDADECWDELWNREWSWQRLGAKVEAVMTLAVYACFAIPAGLFYLCLLGVMINLCALEAQQILWVAVLGRAHQDPPVWMTRVLQAGGAAFWWTQGVWWLFGLTLLMPALRGWTGAPNPMEADGAVDAARQQAASGGRRRAREQKRLAALDPAFSRVVLVDFLHALFHRFHHARVARDLEPLLPYLGEEAARQALRDGDRDPRPVELKAVVVGGLEFTKVRAEASPQALEVEIRCNLTARFGDEWRTEFVVEAWTLERPAGIASPRPQVARAMGCPCCGAPTEVGVDGRCTHCEAPIARGGAGWALVHREVLHRERLPPLDPGGHAPEAGTQLPSVVAPDLATKKRNMGFRHGDLDWGALTAQVEASFVRLQEAWGEQDLDTLRSLESDGLFASHRFWLERYRDAGYVNRLEQLEVEEVEVVDLGLDDHYESLTVRIRARGYDVTLDAAGELVGGSRSTPRAFSEYWTFVRTIGAAGEHAGDPARCPACGAPRDKVDARGVCGYCEAHIVGGEHDWILALIEQDEEYGR